VNFFTANITQVQAFDITAVQFTVFIRIHIKHGVDHNPVSLLYCISRLVGSSQYQGGLVS
jgi:hypothetical protein